MQEAPAGGTIPARDERARRSPSAAQVAFGRAAGEAVGLGAMAVGATAIGALAIGALAIRALAVRRAKIGHLEIAELDVGRLRVRELVVEQERPAPPPAAS